MQNKTWQLSVILSVIISAEADVANVLPNVTSLMMMLLAVII